jgi:hypothetical protein
LAADKRAIAAHGGDFAHLGHRGQAASQLANDFFFVAAQLVDVDYWACRSPRRGRPCG